MKGELASVCRTEPRIRSAAGAFVSLNNYYEFLLSELMLIIQVGFGAKYHLNQLKTVT